MTWIYTKDRLPDNFDEVLITTDYRHNKRKVEIAYYDIHNHYWSNRWEDIEKEYVTAWMPLPEPAEER